LAFVRELTADQCLPGEQPESVVCVFSVAHHPVSTTVTFDKSFAGRATRDLSSGAGFPPIGADGTLTLTLPSHGFYWLSIS